MTLLARLDDTRSNLARESASMFSRTRRAGFDLARAVRAEGDAWRAYLEGRQKALREELASLASPRAAERAILKAADGALSEALLSVQARLALVEAELRRARRKKLASASPARLPARTKKAAPRARARARGAAAVSAPEHQPS